MPAAPAARRRPLDVERGARAALHSARAREIVVRRATREDAPSLAALSNESSAYYARLAPELFAEGDLDGFAEWIAAEWDDGPGTLALVAEVACDVAGYLEAVIQEPEEWRRFFGARDFRERRLSSTRC